MTSGVFTGVRAHHWHHCTAVPGSTFVCKQSKDFEMHHWRLHWWACTSSMCIACARWHGNPPTTLPGAMVRCHCVAHTRLGRIEIATSISHYTCLLGLSMGYEILMCHRAFAPHKRSYAANSQTALTARTPGMQSQLRNR